MVTNPLLLVAMSIALGVYLANTRLTLIFKAIEHPTMKSSLNPQILVVGFCIYLLIIDAILGSLNLLLNEPVLSNRVLLGILLIVFVILLVLHLVVDIIYYITHAKKQS